MFGELLFALLLAFVLAIVFALGFGRAGPWGGFLWFFLIIFLGAWAIGLWATPVGPPLWGVSWVPILFGALLLALLLAAIPPYDTSRAPEAPPNMAGAAAALGVFFWALLLGLGFVIALAFFV